jgi:hypothetical protein
MHLRALAALAAEAAMLTLETYPLQGRWVARLTRQRATGRWRDRIPCCTYFVPSELLPRGLVGVGKVRKCVSTMLAGLTALRHTLSHTQNNTPIAHWGWSAAAAAAAAAARPYRGGNAMLHRRRFTGVEA